MGVSALGVVSRAEAADYFLEIDGIDGKSQDADLPKAVELQSFS